MRSAVTSADLFSLPFRFSIGSQNDKEKRTLFGGIISITILSLSLLYFIYICYLYNTNRVQPNIGVLEIFTKTKFTHHIDPNFALVGIKMDDGKTLRQFQEETKKVYTMVLVGYNYTDPTTGVQKTVLKRGKTCSDKDFSDYFCFDMNESSTNGMELGFDPNGIISQINILFAQCNPTYLEPNETCETDINEINDRLLSIDTNVELLINLQQYNTETKSFESKIRSEEFLLDETLSFITSFQLIRTQVNVIDGFVAQTTDTNYILTDYKRSDQSLTQVSLNKSKGINLYGMVILSLGDNNERLSVQYPPFTQLLAQFSSLFNSLLVVGVICRFLAETEMGQDLMSVHLKVYYKKTAAVLLEKQQQSAKSNLINKDSQNEDGAATATAAQGVTTTANQIGLLESIQKIDFSKEIKKTFQIGFMKRIMLFVFPPSKADIEKSEEPEEVQVYKRLFEKSSSSIDIYSIQKELLEMKMMLKLMLTPEQYSAMQLCGSSVRLPRKKNRRLVSQQQQQQQQQTPKQSPKAKVHPFSDEELHPVQRDQSSKHLFSEKFQLSSAVQSPKQTRAITHQGETKGDDHQEGNYEIEVLNSEELTEVQKLNHLELMDQIDEDFTLLKENFNRFLQAANNTKAHRSELDQRIQNCLISIDPPLLSNLQ